MEIKEIEFESECYPRQLKNIQNPPQKLYVLGDEKILNNECISIVGSRVVLAMELILQKDLQIILDKMKLQ